MYLIKLLRGSSQFRVRAQAAISLGLMDKSFAARNALTAALQDPHPAVRSAAAISLGRIGDANHVVALRMLAGDPEQPVRNAARVSITRLESEIEIEESPVVLNTAARSATTDAHRL
jgi:HEAT repeat protein